MTDPAVPARPVPRWLHRWAVLAVCATVVLLVLGQLVTTFRAGMADPIWPTEPWYLLNNYKVEDPGYLIEHAHRIAGFTVGVVVAVLALGVWSTAPGKAVRWAGLAALVALLVGFGDFHRAMIAQRFAARPAVPVAPVGVMAAALGLVLALALNGVFGRTRGAGLRLLAVVTLVAVMAQGLLGGLRVRLNDWFGTDFAIVHGVFAQVVFCLLVSVAVLTGRPPAAALPESTRRLLKSLTASLVALLFVQLIWGALVRHAPTPLNQRLHILTAFLVVAVGVWLLRAVFTTAARPRVGGAGWVLGTFLVLQVALGVEAWMTKFGEEARAGKTAAAFLPEAQAVTRRQAEVRTAHTLIGTGVLAAAAVLALGVRRAAGVRAEDGAGRRAVPRPGLVGAGQPGGSTC